jgi:PAS domain S-box-containing protein
LRGEVARLCGIEPLKCCNDQFSTRTDFIRGGFGIPPDQQTGVRRCSHISGNGVRGLCMSVAEVPPAIYKTVFHRSPVGEYLLSPTPEAMILAVNDTFLSASGRTREELVGVSLFTAFAADPDDPADTGVAALKRSLARVVSTGKPDTLAAQRYPIRITLDDGSERYEERYWSAVNTPIFDSEGHLVCIAHSTIDVTALVQQRPEAAAATVRDEHARTEAGMFTRAQTLHKINEALEAERVRLMHLFEHAPGFVYFTSGPQHVIERANAALYALASGRELVGKTVREAFPEVEGQGFFEMHDQVYQSGQPEIVRSGRVLLRASPEAPLAERYVDLVYQPIFDEQGNVLGICGQGNDITQRRRIEDELQEASHRKDEFLAMLAHELRNPLAPIRTAAAVLANGKCDAATLRRTSDIIERQVRHMTELVDDLLDVSRVTRGLVCVRKEPQDMKQIVADAAEQVQPIIAARQHRLTINVTSESAFVEGDDKRLVQILTNLLNNAAKYTPPRGDIELNLAIDGGTVQVSVVDNGIGIRRELQSRVFELFAQADRSVDRSQGGLGLGLALVKTLVELHRGRVRCFSEGLDQGSRFIVTLPRMAEAPRTVMSTPDSRSSERGAHRKILLVEDNEDAANMLRALLELEGHVVAVERSGKAGLERARVERPDICLLDIGLPDTGGLEVARRLREIPDTAHTLIIGVSGYGQDADRKAALASGFDRYFVKPVDVRALLDSISDLPSAHTTSAGQGEKGIESHH